MCRNIIILLVLSVTTKSVFSIYTREELTTKPPFTTRTWRKPALNPSELNHQSSATQDQIIVHHNYSRVVVLKPKEQTILTEIKQITTNTFSPEKGSSDNPQALNSDAEIIQTKPERYSQTQNWDQIEQTDIGISDKMDWEQTSSTTNIGTNSKLNWAQTSSHGTGTNNKLNWEQTSNSGTNYKEQTESGTRVDDKLNWGQTHIATNPEQIGTKTGTNWEQINRGPKGHYIVREQINTHQQNQKYRQNPGTNYKLEYKPKYTTNSKKYRNMAFETCPQNSTGPIAYLWSCTQYLNCYKGRGFVQNCAAGTNFNPETLECDFPHKVKCISGARNQKVKSEKYSRLDDISKICGPNFSGLLPHPTDCTKFVNCANGQTFIQDCGPGTAFNSVIQACDFADKVGCEISGQKDNYELQESEIRSFINPNLNYNFEPGSQYLDQNYKDVSVIRVYDNNQLGYGQNCGSNCPTNNQQHAGQTHTQNCPNNNCGPFQTGQNFNQQWTGQNHGQIQPGSQTNCASGNCKNAGQNCHGPNCGTNDQTGTQFTPTVQEEPGQTIYYGQSGPKCEGLNCGTSQQTGTQFTPTYYGQSRPKCEGQNCGTSQQFTPTQYGQSGPKCEGQNCGTNQQTGTQFKPTYYGQPGPKCEGQNCGTSQQFTPTQYGQSGPKCDGQNCGTILPTGTQFMPTYYGQSGPKCEGQNCGTGQQTGTQFTPIYYGQSGPKCEGQNCGTSQQFMPTQYGQSGPKCEGQICGTSQQTGTQFMPVYQGQLGPKCEGQNCGTNQQFTPTQYGQSGPNCDGQNCGTNQQTGQNCGSNNCQTNLCNPNDPNCNSNRESHQLNLTTTYWANNNQNRNHQQNFDQFQHGTTNFDHSQSSANTYSHPNGYYLHSRPNEPVGQNFGQNIPTGKTNFDPICPTGHSGIVPHPFICKKFLNCAAGQTFIQECSLGKVFNPKTSACDWPHNVKCSTADTQREIISQNPTIYGGQNFGQSSSNTYSHPTGHHLHSRPTGHSGRYIQTSGQNLGQNISTGKTNSDPICPAGYSGIVPHPSICKKFLNCAAGQTFIQDCGPGTVFNPKISACDWPHNVKCPTVDAKREIISQNQPGFQSDTNKAGQNYAGQNRGQKNYTNVNYNSGQYGQNTGQYHGQNFGQNRGQTAQRNYTRYVHNSGTNYGQNSGYNATNTNQNSYNIRGTYNGHHYGQNSTRFGQQFGQQIAEDTQTSNSEYRPIYWTQYGNHQSNIGGTKFSQNYGQNNRTGINQNSFGSAGYTGVIGYRRDPPLSQDIIEPVAPTTLNYTINVNQNPKKTGKHWPPPFPSTDTSADYYFEDVSEPSSTKTGKKIWKNAKTCGENEFECSKNECIPENLRCNGKEDCTNGSDEKDCRKYSTEFTLIPNSRLYRHEVEKWLNTDLETCAKYCLNSKNFGCKSFNYRKENNVCLLCDSNVGLSGALADSHFYDYYEITAEAIDCSNMHKCSNKKCIKHNQICDGNDDCGNREDEKKCSAQSIGYEMKLAGSNLKNEGRIEVKVFNEWGYVCDDKFGLRNADVVCKELGFNEGALEVKSGSFFAKDIKDNETYYLMDDVQCVGNESTIKDCDFNGWGTHNCMPQEIVGVVCKTAKEICPPDHWKCDTTKECLPMQFLCDGVVDCFDRSDEGIQHCETPNEVRIVNGTSKYEGRVEIRYHGVWGTICDDDFNDMTAKVVCNSLGFHGSAVAKKDGAFGPGSGPIWLDQLNCYGNESAVEDCAHWNWGEHNCAHDEDAGVVCSDLDASEYEKRSKDESMIGHFPLKPNLDDTLFEGKCGFRGDDLFNDESNENSDIHFRVVKGSTARKGDYPWQATIRVKGLLKSAHWCGAVVISNKYVLTAAHCLVGFAKGSYIINAGDYNIDEEEGTESEAYIEDFFVHEKFRQGGQMNNDIALIKLKGSGLKLSKQIQPICLPNKNTQYRPGLNCTISGFGSTETGKSASSRVLRAGWVKIQPDDTCKMSQVYGDAITNGMFCAGSLDEGVDSCDGDSGGPLACLENGLFTLYGITSWGQRCGHANKPGVYVKVVEYRDWIDRMIQSSS